MTKATGPQTFIGNARIVALAGVILVIAGVASATIYADNAHVVLALQTLSGNWSPPSDFNEIGEFEFAITAILAILINWGTLIGAFVIVYKLLSKLVIYEDPMPSVKKVLELEEEIIKMHILNKLGSSSENAKLLNDAFSEAANGRENIIKSVFGEKSANKFKDILNRRV